MKRITNGALTALTTLSRIPVPFRFDADYSLVGFFLPLIGIPVGLPLWAASYLTHLAPSPIFLALPGLFLQYWIFNLFHFDGFLDSADGLFYQGTRERRLEILKDSRIGAYALFSGTFYLIAKVAFYCLLLERAANFSWLNRLLLFSLPTVSGRLACAYVPLILKPARPGGFGSVLVPYHPLPVLVGSIVAIAAFVVGFIFTHVPVDGTTLAISLPVSIAGTVALVTAAFGSRIGGYTGDTLGATIETGELLAVAGMLIAL